LGDSLIEILITLVILMVGLLGLAALQGRALSAQTESYQRSQALILLKDMADRIRANSGNATLYVTTSPLGTGATTPATANVAVNRDLTEWHNELLGAAETEGGANVGAMIGARGCVYQLVAPASGVAAEFLVAVAWQGLAATVSPAVDCGQGNYGADDRLRRVVTMPVSVGDLN
jgi:type IV pilus assembly protein PilV